MAATERQFHEAFESYADELLRHAVLRLSDRERALELTQESFLRTWEYMRQGKKILQYRPFLFRVLNNLIIDEYRRHKAVSLEGLLAHEESAIALEGTLLRDELDMLEEAAVKFEAGQAIQKLAELPEDYRAVIVMRYLNGLSPGEIADILNESENTVSVRIHRGLRKLRDLLTSSPQMKP